MATAGALAGCRAIAGQSASSRTSLARHGLRRPFKPGGFKPGSRRRRQPLRQRALRHQHGAARVRQHERQALRRIRRVERQIRRSRLQDAQETDRRLQRPLHVQTHHRLRADPQTAQMVRQPVRLRVQRRVAQFAIPVQHRNRVRRRGGLRREQIDHARGRHRARRRVPVLQHHAPLIGRQQVETAQRLVYGINRTEYSQELPLPRRDVRNDVTLAIGIEIHSHRSGERVVT